MVHYISKNYRKYGDSFAGCDSLEPLVQYLESKDRKIFAHDTEDTGLDPIIDRLLLWSIGDARERFVVDATTMDVEPLRPIMESDEYTKIAHNAKFDYQMIYANTGIKVENQRCTMLNEQIIQNGKDAEYNLFEICLKYTKRRLNKDVRTGFIRYPKDKNIPILFTNDEINYSAEDIQYLPFINRTQVSLMEEWQMELLSILEGEVTNAYAEMEYNGFCVDVPYWKKNIVDFFKLEKGTIPGKLNEYLIKLSEVYDVEQFLNRFAVIDMFSRGPEPKAIIKWNSPQQTTKLFKHHFGLDVIYKDTQTKEYKEGTPKQVIEKYCNPDFVKTNLREDYELSKSFATELDSKEGETDLSRFMNWLWLYRDAKSKLEKYGDKFLEKIHPVSGMVHTRYNQCKAETGRVTSGGGKKEKKPNLQNIPRPPRFRNGFITRFKDGALFTADYSGMELRIMADGANDPIFIEIFNSKQDPHAKIASLMNGNIEVTKKINEHLRQRQKTINFGLAYGAGAEKFAPEFGGDKKLAQKELDKFAKLVPHTWNYLQHLGSFAQENGYAKTFSPFNRTRWFPDWEWACAVVANEENEPKQNVRQAKAILGAIRREAMNMPIQGTSADIMKQATVNVRKFVIKEKLVDDVLFVNQVHDELVLDVRYEQLANQIGPEVEHIMVTTGAICIKNVIMEVEWKVSKTWQK